MIKRPIVFVIALALCMPGHAQGVTGPAVIIDGDTIEVGGARVRLLGIDAIEFSQTCQGQTGGWACGERSRQYLQGFVNNRPVICVGTERDDYGRQLATCKVAGIDVGAAMLEQGWAVTYIGASAFYTALQNSAHTKKLGIWSSTFEEPRDYRLRTKTEPLPVAGVALVSRARSRAAPAQSARNSCAIKGNNSRRGERIYHLPGEPYYVETRAEAVFCTEAQAQAAGYRRSRAR